MNFNIIGSRLKESKYGVFFWSIFSRVWTEYGKIRTRKNSIFGHFSLSDGETFQGKPIYEINEQQMLNFDKFHFDYKHVLCFCSPLFRS